MYELICHHTYDTWDGLPVDRSPYGRSNGTSWGTQYAVDGLRSGSGALGLRQPGGISIPSTHAWERLGMIEVEMVVRLEAGLGTRMFAEADGLLRIGGYLLLASGPGFSWSAIQTYVDFWADESTFVHLDGPTIEFGKWVTLRLSHDGLTTLRLSVDDQIRDCPAPFPTRPVSHGGVVVGNDLSFEKPMGGEIDELRVWRLDPQSMRKRFLARPFTEETAECWIDAIKRLIALVRQDPEAFRKPLSNLAAIYSGLLSASAASGDLSTETVNAIAARFHYHWSHGQIVSPEMFATVEEFVLWWRRNLGEGPEQITRTIDSLIDIIGAEFGAPCDPEFLTLVDVIGRQVTEGR